tara:strand:- start:280 stop:459 length:180 start_codon:yes stop_codon:yes gene_type:complete
MSKQQQKFDALENYLLNQIAELELEKTDKSKKKIQELRKQLVELRLNNPQNWSNFNLLY